MWCCGWWNLASSHVLVETRSSMSACPHWSKDRSWSPGHWFRRIVPPTRQGGRLGERSAAVDHRPVISKKKQNRTPPTQPSVRQHQRSADEGKVDRGQQLNATAVNEQPPKRNTDEAAAPPRRNAGEAQEQVQLRSVWGLVSSHRLPSEVVEQPRSVLAEGHRPPRSSDRRWFRRAPPLLVRATD